MKPIRLHWHGGRSGKVNFGDTLSPKLVEAISGRRVSYASLGHCDLVAIGSLMHKVQLKRWKRLLAARFSPIAIWGTGSLSDDDLKPRTDHLLIAAVRGPLTREAIRLPATTPIGDPALLAPCYLAKQNNSTKIRWGIIPHVNDQCDAGIRQIVVDNPQSRLIDVTNPDPLAVIEEIAGCSFVLSSSLHGLIVADALSIPNLYLKAGDRLIGGSWKFRDYAESVGHKDVAPVSVRDALSLKFLENKAQAADASIVSRLSQDLVSSFLALAL